MLDLKGAVVTADAMHCQKETAELIQLKGAEYILFAKDNQPTLTAELDRLLLQVMDSDDANLRKHRTFEINRGREETREIFTFLSQSLGHDLHFPADTRNRCNQLARRTSYPSSGRKPKNLGW